MPLNKSRGNMYDFCTHTHTHIGGKCPHACSYCSVQSMAKRYPVLKAKYSGPLHLIEKEFSVNYGSGKTIFIENCNDMFADDVPVPFIERIMDHCKAWPENTYVFQTKNPKRAMTCRFPEKLILGTTIETNREILCSDAPDPSDRADGIGATSSNIKTFITIEPIMDFDVDLFSLLIIGANPNFVNIGADSKGHNLPEPSYDKVMDLINILTMFGIEIRKKVNLERLKK